MLLPPAARAAMAALRIGAALGLAWLVLDMWLRVGFQVQTLQQLQLFGYAVALPLLAAWTLGRWFTAHASIEGSDLVLDARNERTAVPLASIASLRTWRLPWPASGADLVLASGGRWKKGLALRDPAALARALASAGAPLTPADDFATRLATVRAATGGGWLDHALIKFLVFPLLPALVAFRLHQIITFGGFFGEAYTYGVGAWLLGLGVWWASWALGLMLFAAVLRLIVEAVTALAMPLGNARAIGVRRVLAWAAQLAYYLGVPAWLVMRLLAA
jgi:apolipoprotein N-acyltransferase